MTIPLPSPSRRYAPAGVAAAFDATAQARGEAFFSPPCATLPVTLSNARPRPRGLVDGERYTARDFPDPPP